jgi:uncharacterized RDD family membrane protein YckC
MKNEIRTAKRFLAGFIDFIIILIIALAITWYTYGS